MALHITGDADADARLSSDPFALLLGMLLDQQFPMEKAFSGPHVLAGRLGPGPGGATRLVPGELAAIDPERFAALMAGPPAVHRYHTSMAGRVQALAREIDTRYGGDASALWTGATDGADLFARIKALPGFGDQKARIFVALLAKQLGVRPRGWEAAAGDYALDGFRSVADVVDAGSLQKVRDHKKAVKAASRAG